MHMRLENEADYMDLEIGTCVNPDVEATLKKLVEIVISDGNEGQSLCLNKDECFSVAGVLLALGRELKESVR